MKMVVSLLQQSNGAFNHISCHLSCVAGLLISNKKEELTAILDHFNVQVL